MKNSRHGRNAAYSGPPCGSVSDTPARQGAAEMAALSSCGGSGRFGAAINVFQRGQNLDDGFGRAGIIDGLRIAPGLHQLLRAQLGQVLRQRRLAEANLARECADRDFALNEAAENHQPLGIGHRRQECRGDV